MGNKATPASVPFDFTIREKLLRSPENAAIYLNDFLESGDMELFREGLRYVAKAQEGGMRAVAERANLNRTTLYKALSKSGKPQLETVAKMLSALGLRFTITAAHQ